MAEIGPQEWDKFTKQYPNAHFMQSVQWGELKSSFGWEPARFIDGTCGAQILFRKLPFGLSIAYIPKGPLGNTSAGFWNMINRVCEKKNAVFLKVEPDQFEEVSGHPYENYPGFIVGKNNIQPPNTILIDLRKNEETLLKEMRQKTRYNIRLAARKGVTIETWDDIPAFHKMSLETGGRDEFGVHSLPYFQRVYQLFNPVNLCELLVAKYDNKPLAAVMIFYKGKRAWYVYGASSNIERNRMPAYLLQWEAMRKAKARECSQYDLWGIPDESTSKLENELTEQTNGLWGVYRFKRGFGGEIRRNVQSRDKIYKPFLHYLYELYSGTKAVSS